MPTYGNLTPTQIEQYATDTAGAAYFIGKTPDTLRGWRAAGEGPRYARIGNGSIFYRLDDLREWVDTGRNALLTERPGIPAHDDGQYCMDTAGAAAFIGRSPRTLTGWRSGRAVARPPVIQHRPAGRVFYRVADLREWIDSHLIETGAAPSRRRPSAGPVLVTVLPPTNPAAPLGGGHE